MTDFGKLMIEISHLNDRWLNFFGESMPDMVRARTRKYTRTGLFLKTLSLRIILLLLSFIPKRKLPKYIFEGLRHRGLIEKLPPSDVMILGGRGEYIYCRNKGYRFYWIGYIAKAFELFIWGGKKKEFAKALNLIVKLFLSQESEKIYLFLWEDSQPTGLTLSVALDSVPNLSIVCIAHGMFPIYKEKNIPPEGVNCKFNLVWDFSQIKLVKDGKDSATFVLGLPYEIILPQSLSRKVVLVGHCGQDSNITEYFFSLYHFSKIYNILQSSGFDVSFRPHPTDDIEFIRGVFSSICQQNKHELFASEARTFIGFSSTLLYEARQHQNIVLKLDNSIFSYETDFEVDKVVLANDYEKIPLYLSDFLDKQIISNSKKTVDILSRFHTCIKQIDSLNTKKLDNLQEKRKRINLRTHTSGYIKANE